MRELTIGNRKIEQSADGVPNMLAQPRLAHRKSKILDADAVLERLITSTFLNLVVVPALY